MPCRCSSWRNCPHPICDLDGRYHTPSPPMDQDLEVETIRCGFDAVIKQPLASGNVIPGSGASSRPVAKTGTKNSRTFAKPTTGNTPKNSIIPAGAKWRGQNVPAIAGGKCPTSIAPIRWFVGTDEEKTSSQSATPKTTGKGKNS